MSVTTTKTNKPILPRGNDASPLGYNRAALYSGKALDFDGVNDKINTSLNTTIFSDSGTISGYLKLDGLGGVQAGFGFRLSNQSEFYFLFVNNDSEFRLRTTDGITDVVTDLSEFVGRWTLFTCTFGGGVMSLYADTTLLASENYTGDFRVNASSYYVFGESGNGAFWYDGLASNAKVFNTALTATQVADLYNNPEKVVPTGVDNTALKLWLPMMEGAGTTAYDGSGNGNHGTISGATWTHGIGAPVSQTAVIDWNKGTNLLSRSENAEHVNWGKFFLTATDGETDPLGTSRAFEITEDSTTNSRSLRSSDFSAVSGTQYYYSIIAKQGSGSRYLGFAGAGIAGASEMPVYDLQNGSVDTGASSVLVKSASIEAYGSDGWYKCSMVYEANATTTYQIWHTMCQNATDNGTGNYNYTGNGTSSIFLFAPILKVGSAEGVYVQTIATTQPNEVLLPQGLTTGRDITGVNLFENVRKQGALNLDGNSWAEVHDNSSLDVTTGVSVECWFYNVSGANGTGLFGSWLDANADKRYLLYKFDDDDIRFYVRTATTETNQQTGSAVTTDAWHHVVGTYDGTDLKIYIDGSESGTKTFSGDIQTTDVPITIGRWDNDSSYAYPDQIAQPRIYNRALTAEEVERNYTAGKNIYTND